MDNSTATADNDIASSTLTVAQDKTLSLVPIFSGALSAWGSLNIIYMVLTSKKWTSYRRILLGLSCSDFISSLMLSFQAFLVPAETSPRVYAMGNRQTCTAMGFFQQLAFASLWYSGMLSFYFLLSVRLGVREHVLARKYEPWMHVLAIGYNLIAASVGAGLGFYREQDLGHGCWVSDYPEGCGCKDGADGECCQSPTIAWFYAGLPFLFFFVAILVNNWLVYRHVKSTIQRSRAYVKAYNTATNGDSMDEDSTRQSTARSIADSIRRWSSRLSTGEANMDSQAKRVQAVGSQAFLYVAAIIITYTPGSILRVLDWVGISDEGTLFPLLLLNAMLWPLQGFFNCLAYVRPSYLQSRKDFPNQGRFWAFRRALHGAKVQPTDDMD